MVHKDNKEIEYQKKNWIGYIALFFIIFHFSTILITTFPKTYSPKIFYTLANHYVTPLFNQKWSMFAPCPLTAHQLQFKLYFKDTVTKTITPSNTYLKFHSKLRFTHHGDLATGEYNLMYWIKLDLDELNIEPNKTILESKKQAFYKTRGYYLLKNYLSGYALNYYKIYPIKADVILNYTNVKTHIQNSYIFKNLK